MSDERDAILAKLRLIQSSFAAEFERHDKAIAGLTEQQREVLARATDARVGLKALARTMNTSTPRLRRLLRELSD